MMDLWRSFTGEYRIAVTSASLSGLMRDIMDQGIRLYSVRYIDELTVHANIRRRDIMIVKEIAELRGDLVEILDRYGLFWTCADILKRPVLLGGLILYILFVLYIPTRVLFVRVEGNLEVPTQLILEKAESCGIKFGVSRRAVRSEQVKNKLLSALPELKWAGINTSGCVAVISVRERSESEESPVRQGVCSIVAKTDCVIQDMTVIRGNPLCVPGQAVKEGQLLVSGYTDCGLTVKAERAEAEIYGLTMRKLSVKAPAVQRNRGVQVGAKTSYSIKVGKKFIKISKDSGISDSSCVKMYEENYMMLPGGFQLPLSVIKESYLLYESNLEEILDPQDFGWLNEETERYLTEHMLAGRILQRTLINDLAEGYYYQYGNYACLELIGQVRSEESLNSDGKRD